MTVDLETSIDSAWRSFRQVLAEALDGLSEGESLRVALNPGEAVDDAVPGAEVCREAASFVVAVPSNRALPPSFRVSRVGLRHLRRLGLTRGSRGGLTYGASYPISHVDQAASVAVSALRVAFRLVHPAFLTSEDFTWETGSRPPLVTTAAHETELAVKPVNRDDLDRLVDEALTPMIRHVPVRDSDGDIPFRAGSCVVFVRTNDESPVILVFAEMVVAIRDLDAAVRELDVLNRQISGVKFSLHDDRIVASVELPALPFVGEHLRVLVASMCEVISSNDGLAARRVSGRTFLGGEEPDADEGDESEPREEIHPVMLRLLQLDAERPGSVRPKDAAKLCAYDSDLLVELIRWNEEQEIAWREARDEAMAAHDYDEADACEGERAHAQRTVRILRKALRFVLL
ncbi:T3SS (YopN, CesT) and YbjN peptide-binding chaperone 1 [Intrasporangium calvum]|uniref:Uncharacterized protein n=1 Tax=Intrasporangium calvum (strain ATCC 23552 / DSM 43043 / JCM 3097 / NBRC 12989 / NCIMB 10167 / NRRL B-3866 / 7 KIP) TaxID=710696 RepID=E6SCJ6_INTC7|nr:hypothetical protein [Intrasporangium calvum]ADU49600.1 hypothetical protein Intca_3114 [Intrasporangium calvum DSM 43043]